LVRSSSSLALCMSISFVLISFLLCFGFCLWLLQLVHVLWSGSCHCFAVTLFWFLSMIGTITTRFLLALFWLQLQLL
jgi:hypothetical protein